MSRLRFEECKKCLDWNGNRGHCASICMKPYEAMDEFNKYKNLEEQGLLLKKEDAVDEGYLYDWYIHSVSNDDEPVWTEAHIAELFNDFILIPKAEKALAEMEK